MMNIVVFFNKKDPSMTHLSEKLGICQWFHFEDQETVKRSVPLLHELGIKHLRMDMSWADYHRPCGKEWYRYLFSALSEFKLLCCVWHTPPSISRNGKTNGPPMDIDSYAAFIAEIIREFPGAFAEIELWNEPNNWIKWDKKLDPNWELFAEMIAKAATVAQKHHIPCVLGGMSPVNGGWLRTLTSTQPDLIANMAAIGVHAFPGQWNEPEHAWKGWPGVVDHLRSYTEGRPIDITEVGRSARASDLKEESLQTERLLEVLQISPRVRRIYWYSLFDLPEEYPEIEQSVGGYNEPLEHQLELVASWRAGSQRKSAFFALQALLRLGQVV